MDTFLVGRLLRISPLSPTEPTALKRACDQPLPQAPSRRRGAGRVRAKNIARTRAASVEVEEDEGRGGNEGMREEERTHDSGT